MSNAICSSSIDWAATGAMLQGFGTLAGAVAIIWAANKGANTFAVWRQQKLAERRLDQAERILTATYKARRALAFVRGPLMLAHELGAAEEQMQAKDGWALQTEGRQKRLVTAQAYYNRINLAKDDREALDQCLAMARALFSEELEQAIEKLNRQFWTVQVYVEAYVDDERGRDVDFTKKIRYSMYAMDALEGDVNEVSDAVASSVKIIEDICLPVLKLES